MFREGFCCFHEGKPGPEGLEIWLREAGNSFNRPKFG